MASRSRKTPAAPTTPTEEPSKSSRVCLKERLETFERKLFEYPLVQGTDWWAALNPAMDKNRWVAYDFEDFSFRFEAEVERIGVLTLDDGSESLLHNVQFNLNVYPPKAEATTDVDIMKSYVAKLGALRKAEKDLEDCSGITYDLHRTKDVREQETLRLLLRLFLSDNCHDMAVGTKRTFASFRTSAISTLTGSKSFFCGKSLLQVEVDSKGLFEVSRIK